MEKQYIYRTNDLYEFNTLEEAKKHAELNESCDTITQYNIFSEDDYEEPKQVWVRESRLVEGTSNFGWVAPLPLLVFYTDDEILSMMDYDDENPRNHYDDYETEDAYYDAVKKYEDEYLNKIGICVLSEDDVDRLDKALDDLNGELTSLSDDFYDQAYELETDEGYEENKEEVDHLYDQSAFLDDVATFRIKSGYYEAAYIDCKNNKEIKDLDKEYQDMIFNKINEIKKEFGLTEMTVAWGPLSNGETGYRKVESLKEDEEKKDSIYYCLSDKKMPKHSILLYGEEGRDKLLEIAPKYLEYYGQAEIFKSVNGHKTTIWEDGKLVEEEPVEEVVEESLKKDTNKVNESKELDRQLFVSLVKLGDEPYEGYSILKDGNFVKRIYAESDKEAIKKFRDYINKGSVKEAFNGEEIFVHVFDIDYYVTEEDVDSESEIEEIKANLPQDLYFSFEEYFEDDSELEERIADAISDETGWLVETFDYELLSEEEYNHYSQLKEAKKKKDKVRFVGNPEKEIAFFNHAMGSDASAASAGVALGESEEVEYIGNAKVIKSVEELPKVGEPYGYKDYFVIKVNKKKDKNGRTIYDVISQEKDAKDKKLGDEIDVAHYSFIINEPKTPVKESRDDERVAHYQTLLDELYVTPEETELILKTADEYENTAQRGWISFEEANKVTEKLGLKHLSQLDLSRMWEIVYYTLEKAAFENNGENYEKYSDAASAFAEVINMEARRRKEHTNSDANLEGIVGDRFAIDNDGLLYLYTSAMKDIIAWAKRRGKSIDELLNMSLTKSKDGREATLNLKDYSIEFKRLWDQVREKLEIKENK